MSNKIIVWEDGSWEHEHLVSEDALSETKKHLVITLDNGWPDSQISQMVTDFYNANSLSELFN